MAPGKDKDGKPKVKPSWACRPCAKQFIEDTYADVTAHMLSSQRVRKILCCYGTADFCKVGHEKGEHHLCAWSDLPATVRRMQATPTPPGAKGPKDPKDDILPNGRKMPWKRTLAEGQAERALAAREAEWAKEKVRYEKRIQCAIEQKPFEESEEEHEHPTDVTRQIE